MKINIFKGDITGLDFDLIVNPSNQQLSAKPGISEKIFTVGGPQLEEACRQLHGCPVGQARMTLGYDLPCVAVIHAVGPVYQDGQHNEEKYLEAAYWNSMSLAYDFMRKNRLDQVTLAFPCIAVEEGYPRQEACQIAVRTIRNILTTYQRAYGIHVIFICDQQEDYLLYKKELSLR